MSYFDRPLAGYRFVEVLHGDTLQALALRELGSAARWAEIAHMNGLVPPYITADQALERAGVLGYGDMLMVPAAVETVSADSDPDAVFERDCLLRKGALEDDGAGDFAVASGRENFRQALMHRVVTGPDELLFHPEYRCLIRRLIGAVNGPTFGLLAGEYVRAAISADPRVQSVPRVDVESSGDVIRVTVEVVPVAGRVLNLSLSL